MLSTIPILSSVPENENTPQIRITSRATNASDLSLLRSLFGVAQEGQNYNIVIDGHGTGLKPPSETALENMIGTIHLVQDIALEGADSLPPSVDHSESINFPPIGNQGGEGSCVAFAVGYYVKTFQEAQEHGWDLSGGLSVNQDKIISPDFIYHQINDGEDGGSAYVDAMTLVSSTGACTWSLMPYSDSDHTTWPSESAWREAPLYRGEGGFNVYNFSTSVDSLKTYLAGGNLAVISIDGYKYSLLDSNDLWTLDNYVDPATNHANTVVGYDDNFGPYTESGNPNTYGAFKVANSWGAEWTGDGFYWISYEAMRQVVGYYMFYGDKTGYDPEVIGVFEISHDKRGECDITIGTGDPATSTNTKEFAPYYYNGGPEPFPNNKIILDITELNPYGQNVFIKIYDGGDTTTGTLSSFSAEFYTTYDKSGSADGIIQSSDPPIVTVQNGSIYAIGHPNTITLSASPASITADGVSTTTLTADVKDAYGYAVADGTTITFSAGAGTLSSPTADTVSGIATVTLTSSTVAQIVNIIATDGSSSGGTTVTFAPGPPATITLTADPVSIAADGVSVTTLTADVKDEYGNAAADGTTITFSAGAGTLSSPTADTVSGIASVTLTSDTTIQTVNASATYDAITGTATVEFAAYVDINTTLYHGWNEVCFPFSVKMEDLISHINGNYDGYLYWFDNSEQRYKYYNVVEKTGEPEYVSEFQVLPVGESIWLWIYDETGSITIRGIREDDPLTVVPGWNAIGCTNEESTTMEAFIAALDAINTDYDGYIYWFDDSEQIYKYYNDVEKTGEPEYVSEFTEYVPGKTYWVYYFS